MAIIFLPHEDTRATWRMGGTIRRYGDRITPPTIEPQYFKFEKISLYATVELQRGKDIT